MPQIIRTEVHRRVFFGKRLKFLFVAFNLVMIGWLVSYWAHVGQIINDPSKAFKTGRRHRDYIRHWL